MDLRLSCRAIALAVTLLAATPSHSADVTIDIRADRVIHPVSRLLSGVCIEDVNHEIYGGIYSQMIFGESFQEPAPSSTVKGFKTYGGRWTVRDGAVWIDGDDGPKLVGDHRPVQGRRDRRRDVLPRSQRAARRIARAACEARRRRRCVHRL